MFTIRAHIGRSPGRCTPHPPQSSIHALLGLSYVIWKDLCEARVNLEVCSYLADEPSLADGSPSESGIDALNTAIPNLADKPTLDNGPPHTLPVNQE